MSFFKNKTIIIQVRGISLNFNLISKKEIDELKSYGKEYSKDSIEDEAAFNKASEDEITKLLAKKIIKKDDEPVPTADDLNDLTTDEIVDLIKKVSGSAETAKQALNRR